MQPFLCLRVVLNRRSGRDPSESDQFAQREIAKVQLDFGFGLDVQSLRFDALRMVLWLVWPPGEDSDNSEEALRQH
jgi:hypothetical protein